MTGALAHMDSNSSTKELPANKGNIAAAQSVEIATHSRFSCGWKCEGQVTAGDSDVGDKSRMVPVTEGIRDSDAGVSV